MNHALVNTMMNLSSNFKKWLENRLSKRVKRYFFLASLWAYFSQVQKYDKETLKKLNDVMTLGSSGDSLFIPVLLGKVIWEDSLGNTLRTFNQHPLDLSVEIENNSKILVETLNNIPSWLNYDKREIIENDIRQLVSKMPI